MIKRILFVGDYDKEYNRTKILADGLGHLGVEINHFPFKKHTREVQKDIRELSKDIDIIFLPSFTHKDVKFVKQNSHCPVVFDPLISRYLTKVFDFKQVSRFSPRAYKNYLKDKIAFKYADKIIADTEAHKKYYIQKFKVPSEKIEVVEVGVDCKTFYPQSQNLSKSEFIVGFYGGFIPLQGVLNIVKTAQILSSEKDIVFKLIGNGYEYDKINKYILEHKITNVELQGWIDYKDLPSAINQFDICLGIFGETPKAEMVIPNKIYHYASCRKAIITKETKGIKEVFSHNDNIVLCSSNPKDIAEAIVRLKNNDTERKQIAETGFKLISENYNSNTIAEKLLKIANRIVD